MGTNASVAYQDDYQDEKGRSVETVPQRGAPPQGGYVEAPACPDGRCVEVPGTSCWPIVESTNYDEVGFRLLVAWEVTHRLQLARATRQIEAKLRSSGLGDYVEKGPATIGAFCFATAYEVLAEHDPDYCSSVRVVWAETRDSFDYHVIMLHSAAPCPSPRLAVPMALEEFGKNAVLIDGQYQDWYPVNLSYWDRLRIWSGSAGLKDGTRFVAAANVMDYVNEWKVRGRRLWTIARSPDCATAGNGRDDRRRSVVDPVVESPPDRRPQSLPSQPIPDAPQRTPVGPAPMLTIDLQSQGGRGDGGRGDGGRGDGGRGGGGRGEDRRTTRQPRAAAPSGQDRGTPVGRLDTPSGKLDTPSGKLDTPSGKLKPGRLDDGSDQGQWMNPVGPTKARDDRSGTGAASRLGGTRQAAPRLSGAAPTEARDLRSGSASAQPRSTWLTPAAVNGATADRSGARSGIRSGDQGRTLDQGRQVVTQPASQPSRMIRQNNAAPARQMGQRSLRR